jgi:hypothetical protein
MRRSALVFLLALVAAAVTAAHAGADSRAVWATINVCDTIAHPDSIGIRASMPGGTRKGEQMFMRFQVQYLRGADGRWHPISKGADSGFILVGTGSVQTRQAGRMFVFAPPVGGSFELRGRVSFQWRLKGRVVAHAGRLTTAGHRSAAGSDPKGYSAATCVIS